MDGVLKASIVSSIAVLAIISVTVLATQLSPAVAQDDGSDLKVTFEEYPSLDHVCFIIEAFNAAGTDASFSPRFILNQTSIDVEKANTKLYREREHMYTVTSCNECVAESCAEDNVTEDVSCQTVTVEDCSLCGSKESQKTDTVWEEVGSASAEITGARGEEELKSTFSEVAVPAGGNEKYKFCYYFNEIPVRPDTGMPGSYGYMYLDTGEKLYYDFEHSSSWNETATYRSLTQINAYPDSFLAGSRILTFNGTETELWCDSSAGYLFYNNETGKDAYCVNTAKTATVGTNLINTTFPDTGNPWDSSALYILHLNGTDVHNSAAGKYPAGVTRGTSAAGHIGNGINLNGNNQDILLNNLFNSDFVALPQTGTFLFWFKPNINYPIGSEYEHIMIDKTDNYGTACFWMSLLDNPGANPGKLNWVVGNTSITYLHSNTSSWTAGTWYHIALTWGNTTGEAMYVNGVLEASDTTPHAYSCGLANNADRGLHIGTNYADTIEMNAAFDEIRVYNRTMNSAEINSTYWSQNMAFSFSALGPENTSEQAASEIQGRTAIVNGIREQLEDPATAPIETNQTLYVRYINNTQKNGTLDKVVIYGNQTWAFNYLTAGGDNPYAGMLNITTVFYAWEKTNMTVGSIQTAVAGLIGSTKTS